MNLCGKWGNVTRWAWPVLRRLPDLGWYFAGQVRYLSAATATLATASGFGLGVWLGREGRAQSGAANCSESAEDMHFHLDFL